MGDPERIPRAGAAIRGVCAGTEGGAPDPPHTAPERSRSRRAPCRLGRPGAQRWLWGAAILLVGCLTYGRVVTDYFVMDDFELLTRASRTPWWGAFRAWESREGVPGYWLA